MGEQGFGIDTAVLQYMADEVAQVHALGAQVAIVIGGGNFLRGKTAAATGVDRAQADYMGMLATVMNALALQDALETRWPHHARADRHPDAVGRGAVHPPPRDPPSGKGARRHPGGGYRQPLLHDRYGGGAARGRVTLRRTD